MKRQQLDKVKGKKITGGYGGPRKGKTPQAAENRQGQGNQGGEGKEPMALKLIKGLGGK